MMSLFLAACASDGRAPAAGDLGNGARWFELASGQQLSEHEVLRQTLRHPILLLGEQHDVPAQHALRGRLAAHWINAVAARPSAVVFEHFDRDWRDALREASTAGPLGARPEAGLEAKRGSRPEAWLEVDSEVRSAVDPEVGSEVRPAPSVSSDAPADRADSQWAGRSAAKDAMLEARLQAGHFDRNGWRWPMHRSMFEPLLDSPAEWLAANLSRKSMWQAMQAAAEAGDAAHAVAPTARLQAIVDAASWDEHAQRQLERALRTGHCNALDESMVRVMALMQRWRDAALAEPLLDAGERRTVLLAGNGHVRRDTGVPRYLGRLADSACVIGCETFDDGFRVPERVQSLRQALTPERVASLRAAYDIVCLVPAAERQGATDPCARFSGVNPATQQRIPAR